MHSVKKGNLFILLYIIYFILMSFVVSMIANITGITNSILLTGLLQLLGVFVPSLLYLFYTKESPKKVFHINNPGLANISLALLFGLFMFPMIWLLNLITQLFFSQPINDMIESATSIPYLISVIIVAVFPAIFEELVTRGIFVYNYGNKSIWITSVMSGLVFGMMHLNINQFSYAFVLGFFFSILIHVTGSIITSMCMHFMINFINISLFYVSQSEFLQSLAGIIDESSTDVTQLSDAATKDIVLQSLPGMLVMILISLPFLFLIFKALISLNGKKSLLKAKAPSYMYFEINNGDEIIPDEEVLQLVNKEKSKLVSFKESTISLPLILFSIVFIVLAIIQEL